MITVDEEYTEERECLYKDKYYRVRDNGAVMRIPSPGKRATKNDNIWAFGSIDTNGYLAIAGVRVHLIVAKAFLGYKPEGLVIDHIDTIRTNNRPSNLRYVTRFENLVNNQLTRRKIEHLTGLTMDEILKDITVLHNISLPPEFKWLTSVSQEEATRIRMDLSRITSKSITTKECDQINNYLTKYAIQANEWWPKGIFPFCPQHEDSSLEEYASNIMVGKPIFYHGSRKYIVDEFEISENRKTLAIKCFDPLAVKQFIMISVTYYSRKWFIHTCERFFDKNGLEKHFTLILNKKWTGGDIIDDYC